jgi:hypothetical protein
MTRRVLAVPPALLVAAAAVGCERLWVPPPAAPGAQDCLGVPEARCQ